MAIELTRVKISDEAFQELLALQREVQETPVAFVHGRWLHEDAIEAFKERVDQLAVLAGLPPPNYVEGKINHYGIDSSAREFNRYVPEKK